MKKYADALKKDAEEKIQASISKATAKQQAKDDTIRAAKRAVLEARRRAGNADSPLYGDITRTAAKFGIKYQELRTALAAPGRDTVRAVTGRPPKVELCQAHFIAEEVEQRAIRSRSIGKTVVSGALGAIAASNQSRFSSGGGSQPSKRTVDRFCKHRGLIRVTANETEKARLDGVSKPLIQAFFQRFKTNVLDPNPLLKERMRHGNLDETPLGGRGEKRLGMRRMFALVTKKVLQQKKGASIRTEAIADGKEGVSFVPFSLADGRIICKIFIVAAEKFNPKWIAAPHPKLATGPEFLPRMGSDYFTKPELEFAIYCSKAGIMTTDIFERMITEVIVPRWRMVVPDGPLCLHMDAPESHAMSATLARYLKDNHIIAHFFPHKTSTVLQPLDLYFNMMWRGKFRDLVDALITVAQNSHAYLDDKMAVQFMHTKK